MIAPQLFQKILLYFPARLMLSSAFFSYLLINNYANLELFENNILLNLLHFFEIPAFLDSHLHIANSFNSILYEPPLHIQFLFMIFFAAFAVSTSSGLEKRKNMIIFAAICFIGFILSQFLVILVEYELGIASYYGLFIASVIATIYIGASAIEVCFLVSITKPPKIKIKSLLIKRNYFKEFAYFGILIAISSAAVYFITSLVHIQGNSIVTAYMALNIPTVFTLRHFLSYFFIQLKTPDWLRPQKPDEVMHTNKSLTFLLPAYNEEAIIGRTIDSIDKAASHYPAKTEIVVVNDGSTDHTSEIATQKMRDLKYSTGKVFNIPNAGKGHALRYGLQRSSGEIIFRIDTDSTIDEYAIKPIMNHFRDPRVASVSGNPFVLEEKTIWQKLRQIQVFSYIFGKTEQELVDSIMVQPGAFSVFRKDALLKVGGWADDSYGEDAELTVRLGRYGYKNDFEGHAFVRTDSPPTLEGTREQRLRWAIGYYGVRGRNLDIVREMRGPRSILFLLVMFSHGMNLARCVFYPYLVIGLITEFSHATPGQLIWFLDFFSMLKIYLLLHGMQYAIYLYYLCKNKKYYLVPYVPVMHLYGIIIGRFIAPEAIEILLKWSTKWKQNDYKSYKALGQVIKQRVRFN